MDKVDVNIDWITLTWRGMAGESYKIDDSLDAHDLACQALETMGVLEYAFKPAMPKRFYKYAFKCSIRGVEVHIADDIQRQGMLVLFTGSVLKQFNERGEILRAAIRAGWRCTRLDIAVDWYGGVMTIEEIEAAWRGVMGRKERTTSYIHSKRGDTWTLGSRTSDRFFRVYDKAGEQGLSYPWARLEMEYKGKAAMDAAGYAIENPRNLVHDIMVWSELDVTDVGRRMMPEATSYDKVVVGRVKPLSDRSRWFREQVIPAFRTLIEEDYEDAGTILDSMKALLDLN